MKLYLTEILKEANTMGFGAPGQGGNSANVSMAQTAPGPQMPPSAPAMQAQPQAGGMMLPGASMSQGLGMGIGSQFQLPPNAPFKPMI